HYDSSHILNQPYDVHHMERSQGCRTRFSQGATMNTQLAEGLKSAGMIGVITRPAIVATILFGVWRALGRTKVSARARVSVWWWTVVFLAGWLVTVWVLAVRRSVCVAVKWLGSRSSGVRSPCYPHPTRRGAVRGDPIGSPDRRPGRRSTFLAGWHSGLS